MQSNTLKINFDFLSRLFIGLLFITSGASKINNFQATSDYINSYLHTGPFTIYILTLVIFVEIFASLVYIYGKAYKDLAGYALITFIALTIVLIHNDYNEAMNVQQSLKNLAIIGGLLATLDGVHRRR